MCQTCFYNIWIQCLVKQTGFMSDMYLQYFNTMFILGKDFYVRHVSTIFEYNVYFSKRVLCQTCIYNISNSFRFRWKGVMLDMYLQYHNKYYVYFGKKFMSDIFISSKRKRISYKEKRLLCRTYLYPVSEKEKENKK